MHFQNKTMIIDLAGKGAIVTGSTSGIGHAIARGVAETGAAVVLNGRTKKSDKRYVVSKKVNG